MEFVRQDTHQMVPLADAEMELVGVFGDA